jgi:hypothetical protein
VKLINAAMSLGRHDPPYPGPALRNKLPIRGSTPIAFETICIFVLGILAQILAIVFIKLIFVARKQLFAYLINSAVVCRWIYKMK